MRRWVIALALCLLPVVAWAQCSPTNPTACGGTTLNTLTLGSQINLGSWTTSGRPLNPATGATGFNTTTSLTETWNGSAWVASGGGVAGPGSTTSGYIPTWGNTSGTSLGAGIPTTGTGNAVLSTSPSLTTPALGTPTSLTLTNATGLPNSGLINNTISGVGLGSNLNPLTFGPHLSAGGSTYNGTTNITITSDATNSNTASTIVSRDSSGNFSAGTITAGLTGHASLDCGLSGCAYTGTITGPDSGTWSSTGISATGANVTGTGGYKQNGATVLTQSNATLNGSLAIGRNAGIALPTSSTYSTFVGWGAGQSFTGSNGEATCIGTTACQLFATGTFGTYIGEHAGGFETTANANTAVGNDSQRNNSTIGNITSVGKSSNYDDFASNSVALGDSALFGNAASALIGGSSFVAGDTLSVTLTSTGIGGGATTATYTVVGGDTLATVVTGLAAAINSDTAFTNVGGGAFPGPNIGSAQNTLAIVYYSTAAIGAAPLAVTEAVTGTGNETITLTAGSGQSSATDLVAIGYDALWGGALTTGTHDVAIGQNSMASATTAFDAVAIGYGTAQACTTCNKAVYIGYSAGLDQTTAAGTVAIGYQAGLAETTGSITAIGQQAGSAATALGDTLVGLLAGSNLTSGSSNTGVGSAALQGASSSTANNNTAVGANALKGVANSGNDNTAFGYSSGAAVTSGSYNVLLGYNVAPATLTTGTDNIMLCTGHTTCDAAAAATSNTFYVYGNSATAALGITGTNTPSTQAVTVAGTLTFPNVSTSGTIAGSVCMTSANLMLYESGATGCTISLEELKHDIAPLSDGGDFMRLQPISYGFNDPTMPQHRYGFGAHQVNSVDPVLSTFDGKGDLQAFDPNGILALTVAVVQRQQREIWILGAACLLLALWCSGMTVVLVRRR